MISQEPDSLSPVRQTVVNTPSRRRSDFSDTLIELQRQLFRRALGILLRPRVTPKEHEVNPSRNRIKRAFVFLLLVFSLSHCGKSEKPLFLLGFNGTLQTSNAASPETAFKASWSGFLQRKALELHAGDVVVYRIAPVELGKGTLQFWLKINSTPSLNPIPLVKITDSANSFIEVVLRQKTVELASIGNGRSDRCRCSQALQGRGKWFQLTFSWDLSEKNKNALTTYVDGELQKCEPMPGKSHEARAENSALNQLRIGVPQKDDASGEVLFNIHDLALWSIALEPAVVSSSFEKGQKEMDRPLVWSAADLRHFAGTKISDSGARNGIAWTVDTEIGKQENITLPANGKYELIFRVKPLTKVANDFLTCEIYSISSGQKKTLAFWKNERQQLTETEKFETFAIPFSALNTAPVGFRFDSYIPSKDSLLLDTVAIHSLNETWVKEWRFEDLQHTMGVWQEDPDAAKGRGWINAHTLQFGPYTSIGQPGWYRATWRMKIANDISSSLPLVLLDVFAHDGYLVNRRGHKPYARVALSAAEFEQRNVWESKSIEFRYDGANMMEFRAFARIMKPGALLLDTVTVSRIDPK